MTENICSTGSCVPSTVNFACDVDGKHTEITIPADAWDFEHETVWLTQAQFAELYRVNVPAINKQIQNIFEDEELQEDSTISKMEIVQIEGNREVSREVTHYNLEMLIALGYRIRSKVATKFRQWATQHLKELMTKGRTEIQSMRPMPLTFSEALRRLADEVDAHEATKKALEAEKQGRAEDTQLYSTYLDIQNEQKAQINNTKTATAMGTASAAKTSYRNLRSAIRQDADGQLPKIVKGFFSTNDLFDLSWFVSLFKASVTKFCNGNPDWTNEKRAIRKGLTKKLNEIVIDCLYMDMNGVKKSTVRALFSAWKESTKTQSPMNVSDETEHEAAFRSAVGRLICVTDRYQYRDKYNDLHNEPIYGYSYEVMALCLESLPESSCLKYLRDEVEIEDLKREIARVSHDGYELYQVK